MITPILIGLIAAAVLTVSILSTLIFREIHRKGDQAMAKMKLNPDKTISDFRMLLYLNFFQGFVMVAFGIGGLIESNPLMNAGRFLTILYGIGIVTIFYRWWRRF